MSKHRVQLWGKPNGYVTIDTATMPNVVVVDESAPNAPRDSGGRTQQESVYWHKVVDEIEVSVDEATADLVAAQQAIDQEIADRVAGDLQTAQAAAADATAKANTVRDTLMARADAIQAQLNDFTGEADEWDAGTDYPAGDFVKLAGKLYRARQEVPAGTPVTDDAYWEKLGDYSSAGDAIAGALSIATQTASELSAESLRIDGISAQVSDPDTGLAKAHGRITEVAQTEADHYSALSQRVGVTEARMPAGSGTLATEASVTDVESASVTRDGALSDRITTAQASADGAQGTATQALTATQHNATAITAVQAGMDDKADASVVQQMEAFASSGNRIVNSLFANDLDGWTLRWNSHGLPLTVARNYAWMDWKPAGRNTLGIGGTGAFASGRYVVYAASAVPVTPGTRVCFVARVAAHRANAGVGIMFQDASGTTILETTNIGPRAVGGTTIESFDRVAAFADVPAGAVTALPSLWMSGNGGSDPVAWFAEPMFAEVPAGSTTAPAYAPGGDESGARYSLAVAANGVIGGLVAAVEGIVRKFSIAADVFEIIASGTVGMEIRHPRANTYYMRFYAAGAQIIMGINFGASQNLIGWFGPNIGEAACTTANSTAHATNTGNAYFGGTLSSGVLKNAAQSSQISHLAQIEIGPFGTNGGAKVVNFGMSYTNSTFSASDPGNATLTGTAHLERSLNGGSSWTQVSSAAITGNRTSRHDVETNTWLVSVNVSAASTFTDNSTSTADFMYRTRLSGPGFTFGPGGTQRTYVQSVEQ